VFVFHVPSPSRERGQLRRDCLPERFKSYEHLEVSGPSEPAKRPRPHPVFHERGRQRPPFSLDEDADFRVRLRRFERSIFGGEPVEIEPRSRFGAGPIGMEPRPRIGVEPRPPPPF
jgi:hypothetical protein